MVQITENLDAFNNRVAEKAPDTKVTNDDSLVLDQLSTKNITRTFGRSDDFVELAIYDVNHKLIRFEPNFTEFIQVGEESLCSQISIDPNQILTSRTFSSGVYNIKINILKNKIFNNPIPLLTIKEISNDRREIRAIAGDINNEKFDSAISIFISEVESAAYFKEFSLNFDNDILIPSVNVLLNKDSRKHELLIKTLDPLPSSIRVSDPFKVVEEISDPYNIRVDLGPPQLTDNSIDLAGPNFEIDIKKRNSSPSKYKSYNEILHYNVTSSYQHLLTKLEDDGMDLNIQYDYIRPVSKSSEEETYHFESFTHFGSAVERLKNFKYKLGLIETHQKDIKNLESIGGPTSGSTDTKKNLTDLNDKITATIKGFDGFEQFLYFTTSSNSYTWPKYTDTIPYKLYATTSSQANEWLGTTTTTGQLYSASMYDKNNHYNLNKLIPEHIKSNSKNGLYVSFVNMIGQHFDHIWTYIKHITEFHDSSDMKNISKDLVYFQLQSLGIETFDQFENDDLISYILGEGIDGGSVGDLEIGEYIIGQDNTNYNTQDNKTYITASNGPSLPKGDITKEIWKRLYHNATYLLKTKGTERGIRALMSCYGVPSSILNIKEYGGSTATKGPLKDLKLADHYKTFTYQKAGLALRGDSGANGHFVRSNWSSSLTDALSASAKTITFRIKPLRNPSVNTSQNHLFTLSGSDGQGDLTNTTTKDPHLILTPYNGNPILETGDFIKYGKLDLYINDSVVASTSNFPIYNGEMWNIFIGTQGTSASAADIKFGAYQANWLKNILHYTASYSQTEADRALTWGDAYYGGHNNGGAKEVYICGLQSNSNAAYNSIDTLSYSGSLQEVNFHYGELLTHSTLKKQALEPYMYAGNTVSSSYNNIVKRLPLGSNDQQDSSSFHPNIDVNYLPVTDSTQEKPWPLSWEETMETHYIPTPDTVGRSWTSEKVRIDDGTVDDNTLSINSKLETSTLDRQPLDYADLGIFFSPTSEINEDIIYTLGGFRLDDYIGNPLPSAQTSSVYQELSTLSDFYFKKVKRKYNYEDYIQIVQQLDHTLFRLIEQFTPAKANVKTGMLIEPHFLERNKIKRTLPVRKDGTTMTTGSYQTFDVQITTNYAKNKLYNVATSSNAHKFSFHYLASSSFALTDGTIPKSNQYSPQKMFDPGSYVAHNNNLSFATSSRGLRKEKGPNATITIWDSYMDPFRPGRDINSENNQAAQAPIKPYYGGAGVGGSEIGTGFIVGFDAAVGGAYSPGPVNAKPDDYIAYPSSVLLGNVMGGRKSNKYYRYTQYYQK